MDQIDGDIIIPVSRIRDHSRKCFFDSCIIVDSIVFYRELMDFFISVGRVQLNDILSVESQNQDDQRTDIKADDQRMDQYGLAVGLNGGNLRFILF